jgi:hypothetical protein
MYNFEDYGEEFVNGLGVRVSCIVIEGRKVVKEAVQRSVDELGNLFARCQQTGRTRSRQCVSLADGEKSNSKLH